MKRFHVHVSVADMDQSVRFYSGLFASEPTVRKADYAKWMLDNPRVNFAISHRGRARGITHLGIQAEDREELSEVYQRLKAVEQPVLEQSGANCCYAKGDKNWVTDPQGVAWETFLTHGEITTFGGDATATAKSGAGASCVPGTAEAAAAPCVRETANAAAKVDAASCCG